jgi:CelD/BcsL family acetyltransferase involved in cellulose biosynthesis
MTLNVQSIESLEALHAIEPDWRDLWQRDPAATPFAHPDWLVPWTKWLWGGGKLRVWAVRHNGALVALAPFFFWGYGRTPEIMRVSLLGAGITDHLGIVADPQWELEAARAIFDRLAETHDQWHVGHFDELHHSSPLLRAELPGCLSGRDAPDGVCPVLALPQSADKLYASLDPKFRRNLHQSDTRLAREGAEFVVVKPAETSDAIRALCRLHAARWREREEPGVLATDALQHFHLEAAPRLASRGLVRLYTLRINGETIAVQYNLRRDRRVYAYLSGFDPAHARSSPGAALLAFSIRSAIAEGATHFDFLRKREDFKYHWGARDAVNRKLLVTHSAVSARDVA